MLSLKKSLFSLSKLYVAISIGMAASLAVAQDGRSVITAAGEQKNFAFEVVSIRPQDPKAQLGAGVTFDPTPDGYRSALTVYQMILLAYSPGDYKNWMSTPLENAPTWNGSWFVIDARVAPRDMEAWRKQSNNHELLRAAMKSVLKERFRLVIEEKKAVIPDYSLVVKKSGSKLQSYVPGTALPSGYNLPSGGVRIINTDSNGSPQISFYGATISDLVDCLNLASPMRPVRDHTGILGRYSFILPRDPNGSHELSEQIHNYGVDRLGLQLKPGASMSVGLVIRHIEQPSVN